MTAKDLVVGQKVKLKNSKKWEPIREVKVIEQGWSIGKIVIVYAKDKVAILDPNTPVEIFKNDNQK